MQVTFEIDTNGVGFTDLTLIIAGYVNESGVKSGLVNVFIKHTSASLVITENADPKVHLDLESFMQKTAPEDASLYQHCDEGIDDMPSHIRSILTCSTLNVPVVDGELALGRWQGIYLWEHRHKAHRRQVVVSVSKI